MKHDKEIQLAFDLAKQRRQLRDKGFDRITELVKQNGGKVMLATPARVKGVGIDPIVGFEYAKRKGWLTSSIAEVETTNIIYDTNGAGGIVPLPKKYAIKEEVSSPRAVWELVELVEEALGI